MSESYVKIQCRSLDVEALDYHNWETFCFLLGIVSVNINSNYFHLDIGNGIRVIGHGVYLLSLSVVSVIIYPWTGCSALVKWPVL